MRWETAPVFDLFARVYDWFTDQDAWSESCRGLAEHVPPGASRVVDLGCGPGVSLLALVDERPDVRAIGVDRALRMLRIARDRARHTGNRGAILGWVCADAARLPLADNAIDVVTGHSFLYLVVDRAAVLQEMRRALRKGGRVVLMEPNARGATLGGVLRVSHSVRHLVSVSLWRPFSRIHGRFTTGSLTQTLEGAGFVARGAQDVLGGLGILAWADKV